MDDHNPDPLALDESKAPQEPKDLDGKDPLETEDMPPQEPKMKGSNAHAQPSHKQRSKTPREPPVQEDPSRAEGEKEAEAEEREVKSRKTKPGVLQPGSDPNHDMQPDNATEDHH